MKTYPSISHWSERYLGKPCIAFQKIDGSQIRFEYSRKLGWHKYGTRNHLFNENDPEYGGAIDIFNNTIAEPLLIILDPVKNKIENLIAFTEFFGENSFAGQHVRSDIKGLALFDVNIHKKGLISPHTFDEMFCQESSLLYEFSASTVYKGPYTEELIVQIQEGGYPKLNEGAVIKGGEGHNLWMEKIKTMEYKKKLQSNFQNNWTNHW